MSVGEASVMHRTAKERRRSFLSPLATAFTAATALLTVVCKLESDGISYLLPGPGDKGSSRGADTLKATTLFMV